MADEKESILALERAKRVGDIYGKSIIAMVSRDDWRKMDARKDNICAGK